MKKTRMKILCTTELDPSVYAALERIAEEYHYPIEDLIRLAVKFYCLKCVPTHFKKMEKELYNFFTGSVYPHIRAKLENNERREK